MSNLYEILAGAQQGKAMFGLGREFGLSPEQTQAAVTALLPAISMGLKQSTATPEGLEELFALMGRQPDLNAMYSNPDVAFSPDGRKAGNEVLSAMFGSPDASRAVADQAQQYSGVTSDILKKLLPVLAGILISGLMRSGPGQAAPSAPAPQASPGEASGGIGDILREIFKKGVPEAGAPGSSTSTPSSSQPQDGDIGGKLGPGPGYQIPPSDQQGSADSNGQGMPGDVLGQIMRELEKAAREGRLKPVVIGPVEIDIPSQGGTAAPGQQTSGGDIFGQILRDILSGAGGQVQAPRQGQASALMGGAGTAVFGDRLEPGRKVDQSQLDSFQKVFDRFLGA